MSNHDDNIDTEAAEHFAERVNAIASAALMDHPRAERVAEMLEAGGWIFARPLDDGRFELYAGWWADPRMRPADADPQEHIPLVKLPRSAIFGANG